MTALTTSISTLIILPAGSMCYLPMRNQLRFSKGRIVRDCLILFVFAAAGILAIEIVTNNTDSTLTLLPFLVIFCIYYIYSTKASVSQNLGVFAAVCAMMAMASEVTYIIYRGLFGSEAMADNDMISNIMQVGFALLMAVVFYRPLKRDGTFMVDNLKLDWIWLSSIPISAGVFVVLVITVPLIFRPDDDPFIYFSVVGLAVVTIFMYCYMVYRFLDVGKTLMSIDQLKAQKTVFKMQRQQYETMKQTMEENRIVRHDIKHAMQLAQKLLKEGKVDEVLRYLDVRLETMPTDSVHQYCEDGILNAVLNTLAERCDESEIPFDLTVDIPMMEEHQSVDVANYLQNLGENAILGCETVPPKDRRFALTVKAPFDNELFIVSTNSFDGQVRKDKYGYLSTRAEDGGSGLGIPSMRAIVSKYNGEMNISNTDSEFMVDTRISII